MMENEENYFNSDVKMFEYLNSLKYLSEVFLIKD